MVGTLYAAVFHFIDLLFDYINAYFPIAAEKTESYLASEQERSIRLSMATLFVVYPVFLGVTWFLRKEVIRFDALRGFWMRKLAVYLTLFLAAVTIIADLIIVINTFLEGDLTLRFILKALVALLTAAGVFAYFLWDLRRESGPGSKPSLLLAVSVSLLVLVVVAAGFFFVGSPATQRLQRLDSLRVSDLQTIQNEIVQYWSSKNILPESLDALADPIRSFIPPIDPETGEPYEYRIVSDLSFELCAMFVAANDENDAGYYPYAPYLRNGEVWQHDAGRACFTRTLDPELHDIKPGALPLPPRTILVD